MFLRKCFPAVAAVTVLALAGIATPAQAAPISSMSGYYIDHLELVLPPPDFAFQFDGEITQFNGAPVPGGDVFTQTPNGGDLTITGSTTVGNLTTYTFAGAPIEKDLLFPLGGKAVFMFSITQGVVDSTTPITANTLTLTGTETLVSNTNTMFDFSPFLAGGTIQLVLTANLANTAGDYNGLLTVGGIAIGGGTEDDLTAGGTFSQVAAAAIPEPTSLALFGVGTLGLAGWRLRRKQHA
jgi:hypothetical protein